MTAALTNDPTRDSTTPLVCTVGHSNRPLGAFIALLRHHGVTRIVDVRAFPRSRTQPQFNDDALPASLAAEGIGYAHVPALGGRRKTTADSPNTGWRNASFRGYADHMQTAEFGTALQAIVDRAPNERMALMCAEAVPWRCHRSLIADALVVRGIAVDDIVSEKSRARHKLTPFARVDGTTITYPLLPA